MTLKQKQFRIKFLKNYLWITQEKVKFFKKEIKETQKVKPEEIV